MSAGPVGEVMELDHALDFARQHRQAVLVTTKGDGRPQLSNVLQRVGDDGLLRISITADRAKYANLRRDRWAAVHVTSDDFWQYVVLEGEVELSPVAERPDDATVDELVAYYRQLAGEHDDWDEYRRSMVADRRLVARFQPARAYGLLAARS